MILLPGGFKEGCLPRVTKPGDLPMLHVMGTDGTPGPIVGNEPDVIDPRFVKSIIDQGQQGSCCGCMWIGLLMLVRAMMGLPHILLSQASVYGPGNGGRDGGMAIDTGFRMVQETGACPAAIIDPFDWRGFWTNSWPSDWLKIAANYMGLEGFDCLSYDHFRRCYKRGIPVGYGCKGHAVIRFRDELDINSWGKDWGDKGLGQWATEREIEQAISMYGAVGFRVINDPIGEHDLPRG
jgi:hypothetical protein